MKSDEMQGGGPVDGADVAGVAESFRDAFEVAPGALNLAVPLAPEAGGADAAPEDLWAEAAALAALHPQNDFGNGLRLLTYFGGDLAFVPRLGWFCWAGTHWVADEDEIKVRQRAQALGDLIEREVALIVPSDKDQQILEQARLEREAYDKLREIKFSDLTPEQSTTLKTLRDRQDLAASIRAGVTGLRSAHRKHARGSGNTGRIKNMLLEAAPHCATEIDALNAEKRALNVQTGTLFFEWHPDALAASFPGSEAAGEWRVIERPHARADMISKICPVDFDPAAAAPLWHAFLERVMPAEDMRRFLRRWFGYSALGLTTEQKLVFLSGHGRNGKSTMVDTIARILATYGTTLPIESLIGAEQRKGSDATPDLVRLPGARMVRASEPEQGQRLKEALIKSLTGGEAILIRRMMQEFIEVLPEFKLTISGNHKPEIRGGDDGIWRRVLLVDFAEQIPLDEVDPDLGEKLWEERSGILRWIVEGALDWLNQGLAPPAAISEATEKYRAQSDPYRTFLADECEITGEHADFTSSKDLTDAFIAWLVLDQGASDFKPATIARAFKARAGVEKGPGGGVYEPHKRSISGYRGLKIKPEALDAIAVLDAQRRGNRTASAD